MNAGTGDSVSPSSGWRNSGTTVSITATPTNNTQVSYNFSRWTGTGTGSYSGTNNPASITMNGPITENASFTQNPVQVTVQTNPTGLSFSVDGSSLYCGPNLFMDPGSSHTIATTSPQSGGTGVRYVWKNWSGGGAISHTVAPTTNETYTANFRHTILPDDESQYRRHGDSQPVAGKPAEQQFRLVLRHPVVTISLIGLVSARALILARTTRLQLPWADPSQKRRLSRIINLNTFGVGPTASCRQ